MDCCDLDKNGNIDYNEFLAFSLNRTKLLSKNNIEAAFKTFDKVHIMVIIQDGSGKISVNEIMEIFRISGQESEREVFENLIKESDTNGDGELSLKEFIEMMEKFINQFITFI